MLSSRSWKAQSRTLALGKNLQHRLPASHARLLNLAAVPAANLIPRKEWKIVTHLLDEYKFLTILRLVPYRFRNISRTVMPINSNTHIALRYFEEIMTEGSLAAV